MDEEASFRYGSVTDRMIGMSNPTVWIIHLDQPHSPNHPYTTWIIVILQNFVENNSVSTCFFLLRSISHNEGGGGSTLRGGGRHG